MLDLLTGSDLVKARTVALYLKPFGNLGWFECIECRMIFHPPAIHPAHFSCGVYELQEQVARVAAECRVQIGRDKLGE